MKRRVFDLANKVLGIVNQRTPSAYIPFRGDFPLVKEWQKDLYGREVTSGKDVSEVSPWVQDILYKAERIKNIEDEFVEYLEMNGILKDWAGMSSADKSTELIRFMNANSLTLDSLNV